MLTAKGFMVGMKVARLIDNFISGVKMSQGKLAWSLDGLIELHNPIPDQMARRCNSHRER